MNLANSLTLFRIFLVPVFMLLLLETTSYGTILAAAVFILAAITDGLDGYIARSRQEITRFGKLIDPIADKLLITAALLSLVELGSISAWVALIIIGREFAISGLRMLAAADGVVISASKWGKLKTLSQIFAIVALLLGVPGALVLMWISAIITVFSGIDYFLKAQGLLRFNE